MTKLLVNLTDSVIANFGELMSPVPVVQSFYEKIMLVLNLNEGFVIITRQGSNLSPRLRFRSPEMYTVLLGE
jgi:hypothetical protein